MKYSLIAPILLFIVLISIILNFTQGLIPSEGTEITREHDLVKLNIKLMKTEKISKRPNRGDTSYRLSRMVAPIHYHLLVRPMFDDLDPKEDRYKVQGLVSINIKCLERTRSVTLHAKELGIDLRQIEIFDQSESSSLNVTGMNRDYERDFLTIFFDADLTVGGEYILSIPFTAIIAEFDMRRHGIHITKYKGSDGTMKEMVVTQFQKAYAREAFPCFDEPSSLFKATFSVEIGRRENYQSFSNTEKIGDPIPMTEFPGWVWDVYAKTPKIPVYTLAFAVVSASEFVAVEAPSNVFRIPVKTWAPKSDATNVSVKYSTEISAKMLGIFEKLFDYPYTLGKMENVATPLNRTQIWAMENIGLVTFRPGFLIWKPEENTQIEKLSATALIAHEYVHQWFGNLVTCEWWNEFWLNEGFARYFEFVGAQLANNNFRTADRFVLDVTQWAMLLDEGPDSVPVHGNEMELVTDRPYQIEYDKAGALIRMMATFLTQETFLNGLRTYFKKHEFNTTTQDDLFQVMTLQALEDQTLTHYTVKEVMDSWTKRAGFPIVKVSRLDNDTISISQHRFVNYHHPNLVSESSSGLWHIPIWFITKSNRTFDAEKTIPNFWMDNTTIVTHIKIEIYETDYIIVNPEGRGFYRVIYDSHLTNLLIQQLKQQHQEINFATRSQLIDDYFRSAHARYVNMRYALDMTKYLSKEDDHIVWTTALNNLRNLHTKLVGTSLIDSFKIYMLSLILPALEKVGIRPSENDSTSDVIQRAQLLEWACALDSDICIEYAKEMFEKWMLEPKNRNPIPTDYQPQLYCAAVASQKVDGVHEFLQNHYKITKCRRQKLLVVQALACDRTEAYLKTLIRVFMNESEVFEINMNKHGRMLRESLAKNPYAWDLVLNFLHERYEDIDRLFGPMCIPLFISEMVPYTKNGANRFDYRIASFISFYIQISRESLTTAAENSLNESARRNVENSNWMEFFFQELEDWLLKNTQ